ncbi:hypothetical protein AAFF_G00121000 [Aldrovandia affinis]|uniref:Uncharacterized protein n=1 Tax=Aldrovandia affinis TaxID=143900 RepID=A0AAD7RSG3_9TELE|nr:hypothetical protein AAFF_G00121000 [Aldrovandia affinis]
MKRGPRRPLTSSVPRSRRWRGRGLRVDGYPEGQRPDVLPAGQQRGRAAGLDARYMPSAVDLEGPRLQCLRDAVAGWIKQRALPPYAPTTIQIKFAGRSLSLDISLWVVDKTTSSYK